MPQSLCWVCEKLSDIYSSRIFDMIDDIITSVYCLWYLSNLTGFLNWVYLQNDFVEILSMWLDWIVWLSFLTPWFSLTRDSYFTWTKNHKKSLQLPVRVRFYDFSSIIISILILEFDNSITSNLLNQNNQSCKLSRLCLASLHLIRCWTLEFFWVAWLFWMPRLS